MFDMFSKLGEIKQKAEEMKKKIVEKKIETTDETGMIHITTNGKKDILSINWDDRYDALNKSEKINILKAAIDKAMKESESFIVQELKGVIPNIPGMNLF